MRPHEELIHLLRPAAGGIPTFSTGAAEQRALQHRLYRAGTDDEVQARWRATLERLPDARVVVLGIPSDAGAGYRRGAAFGPREIRRALLDLGVESYLDPRVVDLGDVLSIPQLLDDEMLGEAQLARTRHALYAEVRGGDRFPVSPLSIAARALAIVAAVAPGARPLLLGGDHSVGWPGIAAVARGRERRCGIVHFDAHTDLLTERLGVRMCFATWAWHANELVGRGGRLQQVGIRTSGRSREHWESALGVRQFWMEEVRRRGIEAIAEELVGNLRSAGVQGVYVSNDVDGTDPAHAPATGTPEPGGLSPGEVEHVLRAVGAAFPIWGSDVVEVAPPLGDAEATSRTLRTAAGYVDLQLGLMLAEA